MEWEWWQITLYLAFGIVIGWLILLEWSRKEYLDSADVGGVLVMSALAWPLMGFVFGSMVVLNRIATYFNER